MSYSIHYHQELEKKEKERCCCLQIPIAAAMVILSAYAITCMLPIETARLRECLVPWTQEKIHAALVSFQEDLRRGDSCQEALTAFCAEMLDEADMPQ